MVLTPLAASAPNLATASATRVSSSPHSSGKFCWTSEVSTKMCSCM